jgi:hypothetical protein
MPLIDVYAVIVLALVATINLIRLPATTAHRPRRVSS